MPCLLLFSVFYAVTGSVAVMTSGGGSCGPQEGGGCPDHSMCVLQQGGRPTCVCDEQAVQHCVDEWEDFIGSGGLSQCYVADNTSSCSCLASSYNTGSRCLSVWWVVGPAVGGAVLMVLIFITVIVFVLRQAGRQRAGTGDGDPQDDRTRTQTNASMLNLVEFPSRKVSRATLEEADRGATTQGARTGARSKVGYDEIASASMEEEEGAAGRVGYDNAGVDDVTETPPTQGQNRRSYHAFEMYDNNFKREPEQLRMNMLYGGSSQAAPRLNDEGQQMPPHIHAVQPYAVSPWTIPRPSIILEEDDTI